ncbi:MAG TPA: hypothetical protein PLJ14_11315, partial [Accumulibacter sp.]|nr:hypothetical protein [Accumulibacter sp.]HNL14264.1 hypothetical protein [Accumulibacter sp.]HNL76173.1 hypothetical protein [Accumulibacter sp.]
MRRRGVVDGHAAGRRVVDVGDRGGRGAGDALGGTQCVGIAGDDGERRADIGLGGGVGRPGGAGDIDAAALPLITDRPETIEIGERVRRGERLAL